MNRNFGISAGAIALGLFALHIAIPSGQNDGAAIEVRNEKSGKSKAAPKDKDADPENIPEREGPWLATQSFFSAGAKPKTRQLRPPKTFSFDNADDIRNCSLDISLPETGKNCAAMLREYFGVGDSDNIRFLLATVPDPLHSRLSLSTDSSIEAIQKAATYAGWQFATQWLPWSDEVDPDERNPSVRTAERAFIRKREKQPGILVLRPKPSNVDRAVLLIFLVGETPTAGVNSTQFQIARSYMRAIQEPEQIRIQGPTFSGSLYSLRKLLEEDKKPAKSYYLVRSGTVTDEYAEAEFGKKFNFRSEGLGRHFMDALDHLGIQPEDAALLVEDETEYGEHAVYATHVTHKGIVKVFRFPRDISHLRNAYRESLTKRPNGAPAADLDFSLKDSDVAEDSIPTFSKTQTALSQNGVLNEITGAIRRDGTRIIQIEASNVLDLLFLTRVLKQQCPDTRLLIPYADLLFVQAAQSDALTGTLALSRYPLFVASNEWMKRKDTPLIFSGSNAEGVFNASVLLLRDGAESRVGPLSEYQPQWLLTLDREGFTPVKFWPEGTNLLALKDSSLPARWLFIAESTALLAIALLVWMMRLWWQRNVRANAAFTVEAIVGAPADPRRLFYLFLLPLILAAMQAVLYIPFWLNRPDHVNFLATGALLDTGIVCSLLCAVFALVFTSRVYKLLGVLAFVIFLVVLVLWRKACSGAGDSGFFFSFRAVEMRIGTSPMWPVIAALSVLVIFSLVHLTRLYLAVYEKPEVSQTILRLQMKDFYSRFNSSVESLLGLWTIRQGMGAMAVVLIGAILFGLAQMGQHLSSIDVGAYDILSIGLILAATAALLLTCWQVTTLWHSLQGLLTCLQTLPLARAFIPPDGSGSSRPLWVRRLSLQSIDILADAIIVLHDISLLDGSWVPLLHTYSSQMKEFVDAEPLRTRLEAHELRVGMRETSKTVAVKAFDVAREEWRAFALVEKYDPHSAEQEEAQCRRRHAPLEITGDPTNVSRLAETFVALHYSSFLLYGVSQIRNLLLFLSSGFVLLVVALNSYSHQSPQLIGRLLLAVFVLIGAVIWTCLSGMERDPILSRIAGTAPGKLSTESYFKVLGYGALPVLGLLASQFPSISNFLYSWIAPSLQSVH